jgi:hypothetical protein
LDEFFQAVENISSHEIVSKHAFWALSSLIIGREVSNTQLLLLGSRMYGQALTELRAEVKKMRNSSLPSSAEMALTCNLLALYEVGSLYSLDLKRNILTSCRFLTIQTRHALASLPIAKGLQNWCGSEGQVDFAPTSRAPLSRAFEWPSSSPQSSVDGLLSSLQRSGAQSPGIQDPNQLGKELSTSQRKYPNSWRGLTEYDRLNCMTMDESEACSFSITV